MAEASLRRYLSLACAPAAAAVERERTQRHTRLMKIDHNQRRGRSIGGRRPPLSHVVFTWANNMRRPRVIDYARARVRQHEDGRPHNEAAQTRPAIMIIIICAARARLSPRPPAAGRSSGAIGARLFGGQWHYYGPLIGKEDAEMGPDNEAKQLKGDSFH